MPCPAGQGILLRKHYQILKEIHIELRFSWLKFTWNVGNMLFVMIEKKGCGFFWNLAA